MKKRILFVDDEPLVLQGLQRSLRPMRQLWDMEFVDGGERALESARTGFYDVIVSDMMMPGMNGAQLLEEVRRESPRTIRLVLSGHTDKQLALQCVGVAHQFLAKPCEAQDLGNTLARVTGLGFAFQNEYLMKMVGCLERLPSPPAIYSQLVELFEDPLSSMEQISALIARDMALTAHLLKIVNSAFFGLPRRVNEPAEAVSYLGLDTLKAVVLTAGLFAQWAVDPASGYSIQAASDHCQQVGAVARLIARTEESTRSLGEECFIAGLLHDVGKLVLACNLPAQYARVAAAERSGLEADEMEIFGTTHAEIGGYLLGLWGLPCAVVEATRLHHTPGESLRQEFTSLTAVHVADHFVRTATAGFSPTVLDEPYLASIGLAHRIPTWRAAAADPLFSTPIHAGR